MMKVVLWIASKSKIFRNDILNLQTLQLVYSHLMKQGKNSCCLSGSEFTSFGLNLVTVFSRRCFSFLSNVLSFFFAIKKKEYLVRGLGLHKPQYKIIRIDRFRLVGRNDTKTVIHVYVITNKKSLISKLV